MSVDRVDASTTQYPRKNSPWYRRRGYQATTISETQGPVMWQVACLLSCFAVTLGCGTLYAYSAYAPQLSDRLSLSASTISAVGMIGNFAMAFSGPFAGMIVDNVGFALPICISIVCTFVGYLVVLVSYNNAVSNVPSLAFSLLLVGIGCTCAFSASVKCAAVNFPQIRGTATATTMSGYGLSAFAMSLIAQMTNGSMGASSSDEARHMLTVLTVVPTVLMCVFGPVVISSQPKKSHRGPEEYGLGPIPSDSLVDRIAERPLVEKELSGIKMLKQPIFCIYFLVLGLLSGMGQAYIYTCGYMVKALVASALAADQELSQDLVSPIQGHQVAILSLANCSGRLISGTISDTLKTRFKLSRLYTLFFSVSLCLGGMFVCARLTQVESLWIATVLVGLFYGTVFGAFPGIISDSFGVRRLSSNWGLVALSPIPFTSWLAVRIGRLYDAHADASGKCVGPECFAGAFNLHIFLSLLVLALLVVAVRIER